MSSEKKVQIIYHPGTFGNLLRWLLDRFSPTCKFKHINNPWDENNRVHRRPEAELFNKKITGVHQFASISGEADFELPGIVINFKNNELVFAERCGFYRNPGNETEQTRYNAIIQNFDDKVLQLYRINKKSSSKSVAKELIKIQLHNHDIHTWWNKIYNVFSDVRHYHFPIDSFWNKNLLILHLYKISKRFTLNLEINETIIENITHKIEQMYVIKTKQRAEQTYDAIKNKKNLNCSELDIWEQAWIEVNLENTYDSLIFPYGTNWFINTDQINEFIETYPSYLKHMNPRLPWYKGIKNPFYLTGKID